MGSRTSFFSILSGIGESDSTGPLRFFLGVFLGSNDESSCIGSFLDVDSASSDGAEFIPSFLASTGGILSDFGITSFPFQIEREFGAVVPMNDMITFTVHSSQSHVAVVL
jgi:hypothetical protein